MGSEEGSTRLRDYCNGQPCSLRITDFCLQEKLLLSIFPEGVAQSIQRDLKQDRSKRESDFRQLHITRSENVRSVHMAHK